jgi:hypothetical protein
MTADSQHVGEHPGIAIGVSGWRDLLGYANTNVIYRAIDLGEIPAAPLKNGTTGAPLWPLSSFAEAVYRNPRFRRRFEHEGAIRCEELELKDMCETRELVLAMLAKFEEDPQYYATYMTRSRAVMDSVTSFTRVRREEMDD